MNEEFYLNKILQLIEDKLQRGSSRYWKNEDFIYISKTLSSASQILISPNTVKRLYGKIETHELYKPQLDTRNALAIYLGFKDWEDFKLHWNAAAPAPAANSNDPIATEPEKAIDLPVEAISTPGTAAAPRSSLNLALIFYLYCSPCYY